MRVVCAALVFMGCADGTEGETADTGDTTTTGPSAPKFTRVVNKVLEPSCALVSCHAVGAPAINGFVLPPGEEWEAIVNVESQNLPGEVLVVPGDADSSYLVLKLEDAFGIYGLPMPPPVGNLPEDQIQIVRDWIDAGALDN